MVEEKNIEELEAEYKAHLSKKNKAFRAEEEAREADEAKKAAEEAEKLRKEQFSAELKDTLEQIYKIKKPVDGTDVTITDDASSTKKISNNKFAALREHYLKKYSIEAKPYGFGMQTKDGNFAFADPDSGCEDDVSAWSPADTFCDMIWQTARCKPALSGKITAQACDITAGKGLSVQIRTIAPNAADTSVSALGACECATCSSDVFDTYTLTLQRYDLFKVLCGLDLFDVGEGLQSATVQAMGESLALRIDALIWAAIYGASPSCTQTLGGAADCGSSLGSDGACCAYAADLYKAVVDAEASLRSSGYGNFVLLAHPTVAAFMKYKEGINAPVWINNIRMDGNKLVGIGDIEVIEYSGATSCTDKSGEVMAILLDKTRAVGETYGKRPEFLTSKEPVECDAQKLILRTYVAVAALDTGAICHIKNPA